MNEVYLSLWNMRNLLVLLCVWAFCTQFSYGQLYDHIVAYYPLDGDASDLSGHCLNGQVYGAVAASGKEGGHLTAMQFDGVDDYIEIAPHPSFDFDENSDFAVSFWFKIDPNQEDLDTTDNDLISKWVIDDASMDHLKTGYPFTFRVTNNKNKKGGRLIAAEFGGYRHGCNEGTTLGKKIQFGVFHHVVLNVKAGRLFLYLNGQLAQRKGSNVFCSNKNDAPLRLGKRGGSEFENHFKGVLDELLIVNTTLTEEEIKHLYTMPKDLGLSYSEDTAVLVKSDTIYFDDDVFQLNAGQRVDLEYFHRYLELGEEFHLVIEGHSNGIPDDDFCDELSLKRAKVVEDYLLDLGISCTKITARGLGKRQQISLNTTPVLRKKNQRTEIKLYKSSRA